MHDMLYSMLERVGILPYCKNAMVCSVFVCLLVLMETMSVNIRSTLGEKSVMCNAS